METPSPTSSASSPPPLTDTYARATPSTPSPPPPSTPSPEARTPSNKAAPSPPPMVNATSLSSSPAPPPPVVNTTPSSSPAPSLPPVVNTTPPSSSPSPSPPPVVNTTPPSSSPPAASPGDSLLPPFNDHSPPASPPPEESALTPASLSPDDSYPPPPLRQPPLSPPPRKQDSPPPTDTSSSGPRTTEVPSTPSPPSRPPPSYFPPYGKESESHSGVKAGTALGIGVAVAIAVIFAAIVLFYLRKKKRKDVYINGYHNSSPLPSVQVSGVSTPNTKSPTAPLMQGNSCQSGYSYSPPDSGIGNSRSFFTYEELSLATNGFSFQNRLGEGGFGFVYKGFLPDGREVAVKQLKIGGAQGEREFQAEVEIISRVHHRHLVSLIGYCISENQRLLVYDYVPNDTLHHHLHGRGRPVMDWETRVKVAAGAARGLAYLHEDCHPRIIHRDIKTSNILLDNNFEAQVSDFGLAKLTADTNTHVSTRVMGTFGYLAPEYASSGKLTDKSDVFSFGVMLLEIITGRKPVDSSQPLGEESLVEWARPLMIDAIETGKFDQLPDPRLEKDYNEREMFQMIEAASACVRYNAQMRPRMGRVVRVLDGIVDSMDLNNGIRPGQTQIFNGPTSIEDMKCFHRMAFGSQEYSSDFSRTSRKSQRDL